MTPPAADGGHGTAGGAFPAAVAYLVPGPLGRHAPDEFRRREAAVRAMAPAGMRVDLVDTPDGPPSIESAAEEALSVPGAMRRLAELPAEGYAAAILGCFSDPGLAALRELSPIPVIGPGQASMLAAVGVGRRFAIVTILEATLGEMADFVRRSGFGGWCAAVRAVDVPVLGLRAGGEVTRRAMAEEARAAVRRDRADTVIWGCMSMGFLDQEWGLGAELEAELGISVVNPVRAAIGWAQALRVAGLGANRRAYPAPPKPVALPVEPGAVRAPAVRPEPAGGEGR